MKAGSRLPELAAGVNSAKQLCLVTLLCTFLVSTRVI